MSYYAPNYGPTMWQPAQPLALQYGQGTEKECDACGQDIPEKCPTCHQFVTEPDPDEERCEKCGQTMPEEENDEDDEANIETEEDCQGYKWTRCDEDIYRAKCRACNQWTTVCPRCNCEYSGGEPTESDEERDEKARKKQAKKEAKSTVESDEEDEAPRPQRKRVRESAKRPRDNFDPTDEEDDGDN